MLTAKHYREDGIAILELDGVITEDPGDLLPGLKDLHRDQETQILIDMGKVTYVNSIGLSRFIDSYKRTLQAGAKVVVCNLQPHVRKVFKLARVEILIPIYDDEPEAKGFFGLPIQRRTGPPREQILILEQHHRVTDEIHKALEKRKDFAQYRLSTVNTVEAAMKFLRRQSTQCVVADLSIPLPDVEDLIEQMNLDHRLRLIPILVTCEDVALKNADWLIRNGAADILRQPIEEHEISARLSTQVSLNYALIQDEEGIERSRAAARVLR